VSKTICGVICFMLILSGVAFSQTSDHPLTADQFISTYQSTQSNDDRAILEQFARAYENGMEWEAAADQHPFFCVPSSGSLTGSQIVAILITEVTKYPKLGASPYGLAILIAMHKTFPCSNN
jgi:hypothetical protein